MQDSTDAKIATAKFWKGKEVDDYDTTQRLMVEQKREVLLNTVRIAHYFCENRSIAAPDILDIGCGTGTLANMLLKKMEKSRITGVDASEKMLSVFVRDCVGRFPDRAVAISSDFNSADFWDPLDKEYDVIVSSMALHYLSDEAAARFFKEVNQHLRKDGLFVACIGNLSSCIEIKEMEYQFKLEFAYRNRKENGYDGTFSDFKRDFGKRISKMNVNWRIPQAYIDFLKEAGFREVDMVWHLWIKSIYVALR